MNVPSSATQTRPNDGLHERNNSFLNLEWNSDNENDMDEGLEGSGKGKIPRKPVPSASRTAPTTPLVEQRSQFSSQSAAATASTSTPLRQYRPAQPPAISIRTSSQVGRCSEEATTTTTTMASVSPIARNAPQDGRRLQPRSSGHPGIYRSTGRPASPTLAEYVSVSVSSSKPRSPTTLDPKVLGTFESMARSPTQRPSHQPDAAAVAVETPKSQIDEPEFVIGDPTDDDRNKAQKVFDGNEDHVAREKAAAWMGEEGPVRQRTLRAYMELYDFSNNSILQALRQVCDRLVFRAESQQIDRILVAFAARWCQCNPKHGFKTMGELYMCPWMSMSMSM